MDIIGNRVEGGVVGRGDVEFAEADAWLGGGTQGDAVAAGNRNAGEASGFGRQRVVDFFEADELHVRVSHGTTGKRAVVLEKDDGTVLAAGSHGEPMLYAEADEMVHVFGRVVRHVTVAAASLDEHELVGVFEYVVLVAQENHPVFFGNDVFEVGTVTKRTRIFPVKDVLWFAFSQGNIETDQVGFHGSPSLMSWNEFRLV